MTYKGIVDKFCIFFHSKHLEFHVIPLHFETKQIPQKPSKSEAVRNRPAAKAQKRPAAVGTAWDTQVSSVAYCQSMT